MKFIHFLAGDSLVEHFQETGIEGEIIVCRECLIDGDLQANNLEGFWRIREEYLGRSYEKTENFYQNKVRAEFEKLLELAEGNEINLWFEYELFCQVNLWFCLSLLAEKSARINIVYPLSKDIKDIWNGFGYLNTEELKQSFGERININRADLALGKSLWKAFSEKDWASLKILSKRESVAFPTLKEVCDAAITIETRPKNTLQKIVNTGETNFGKVFQAFNQTEKVYGFGDLQVKKIFDTLNIEH